MMKFISDNGGPLVIAGIALAIGAAYLEWRIDEITEMKLDAAGIVSVDRIDAIEDEVEDTQEQHKLDSDRMDRKIERVVDPLITMLISTVFWGLKLETELNQLRESHQILAIEVGGGQLELVRSIDIQTRQDLSRLKRDVEEWQLLHDKNFPPQWLVDQVQHIDKQLDDHVKENSH
jgi:hypothetical protein